MQELLEEYFIAKKKGVRIDERSWKQTFIKGGFTTIQSDQLLNSFEEQWIIEQAYLIKLKRYQFFKTIGLIVLGVGAFLLLLVFAKLLNKFNLLPTSMICLGLLTWNRWKDKQKQIKNTRDLRIELWEKNSEYMM